MTSGKRTRRKPVTAEEFMSALQQNPEYLAKLEERRRKQAQFIEAAKLASSPIVKELVDAGFQVESIADLYIKKLNYKEAIPILIRWLPIVENNDVKESLVRALSVKWTGPAAAPLLIREYQTAYDPTGSGLKWALGNALSVVADERVLNELIELVRDKSHGTSRQMLAVALGNMKDSRAVETLIELLDDDAVAGHAVMALGRLKARKARSLIERFLDHEKSWIRREAKKALAKIDQG